MSYTENPTWVDGAAGGTPLMAANLNHIEAGILDASNRLDTLYGGATNLLQQVTSTSLPTSPFVGEVVHETDLNQSVEYTANGWVLSAPMQNDPHRRHAYSQTNAPLAAGSVVTVAAWSATGAGNIATMTSGTNLLLNKAGQWTIRYQTSTNNTIDGFVYAALSWANGAFLVPPAQQMPRHPSGSGGSGVTITDVSWTGYVTAAQASQPITALIQQNNTNSGTLNGCSYYLSAEYLGG